MNIRFQIMAMAVALLLIFGVAVLVWALLEKEAQDEIAGITDYHLPLTAMTAEVDVITFEYELLLHRLLRQVQSRPEQLAATAQRQREIVARLREDFDRANVLLERGMTDTRNDLPDRLTMARLHGTLKYLHRQVGPFAELGERVRETYAAGRRAEAQALVAGFTRFEEAFGPDLAAVRKEVAALTADSTAETAGQMRTALLVGAGLFGLAVVAGLGVSRAFANRLHGALHHLIDGARAVEAGQLTVTIHITWRDEIGQLAKAFNRMIEQLRLKERIKDTFGKYVDPRIVANLVDTSGETLDTAERRSVTILFSDIKGFSGMSEQLTAAAMVNFLNRYFTECTAAIRARQGIVDKFIGDAVMAFWTAPFSAGDSHAAEACLAALAQQEAVVRLRGELPEILGLRRNVPELAIRIGIATGEVVVGTIGSPIAKSFTVIGDTVNVASRLEAVNKVYGTTILVAEETYRLAQGAIDAREVDFVTVAGKTEPVRIYELLAPAGQLAPPLAELRGVFAEALDAYRRRDWGAAERAFADCLRLRPEDGPARVFRERIALFKANPPPADWDGVWRLAEK